MAAYPKPLPTSARELSAKIAGKPAVVPRQTPPLPAGQREPIAAAKAKAHFLQLLDEVQRERKPITITKRGHVVAQLVPVQEETTISNFDRVFGSMRGTIHVAGDIISPDWEAWGPEWR